MGLPVGPEPLEVAPHGDTSCHAAAMAIHPEHNGFNARVRLDRIKFLAENGDGVFAHRHRPNEWSIEDETIHVDHRDPAIPSTPLHDDRHNWSGDWANWAEVGQAGVNRAFECNPRAHDEPLTASTEHRHDDTEKSACASVGPFRRVVTRMIGVIGLVALPPLTILTGTPDALVSAPPRVRYRKYHNCPIYQIRYIA